MTELINKSLDTNTLKIQWDYFPDDNDTQTLVLLNQYKKEIIRIPLGMNQSRVKYRYGKYEIPVSVLESVEEGLYLYKVFNTGDLVFTLTEGNLKVIRDESDPIMIERADIQYTSDNEETEYITYNG